MAEQPRTDNQLPAVGSVILCNKEDGAWLYSQEHNGATHYSVCVYKATSGAWALSWRKDGGLRVMLGTEAPKDVVLRVRIVKYCKGLTCCFGEVL